MSDPSRSDLRLYERAMRNGWDVPAATRVEVVRMLGEIVGDPKARRRDRTAAARRWCRPAGWSWRRSGWRSRCCTGTWRGGWRRWKGVGVTAASRAETEGGD